ncbi:MAG: NMD3-related protein [Candidatus Thorarchaeota archaeon]
MVSRCFVCGLPSIVGGMCADCYRASHPLLKTRQSVSIVMCKNCGALKTASGWSHVSEADSLEERLLAAIEHQDIEVLGTNVEIGIDEVKKLDSVIRIVLVARGCSHESLSPHVERHPVEIRIDHVMCDTCAMMRGGYHEAVIQVRAENREITDEEATRVLQLVTDRTIAEYGTDPRAYVSDVERNRYGIDFKVGSSRLAKKIGDELERTFLAERKENFKLITQDKGGRRKFRVTIMLRLPRFTAGDIVSVDGQPCVILSSGHGSMGCQNLRTGCRFSLNLKSPKWKSVEFLRPASERRKYTVVAEGYNGPYHLMDMESFHTLEVEAERFISPVHLGDEVDGVTVGEEFYVLPNSDTSPDPPA